MERSDSAPPPRSAGLSREPSGDIRAAKKGSSISREASFDAAAKKPGKTRSVASDLGSLSSEPLDNVENRDPFAKPGKKAATRSSKREIVRPGSITRKHLGSAN